MNCPDGFWCFQLRDAINTLVLIATIAAIIIAPISAVNITRKNDELREKRKRQYDVFHTLMKTRRSALAPERVAALNLVQLEFSDYHSVLGTYKRYIEHLSIKAPEKPGEMAAWTEEREDRLFDLLHEVGATLGFALDKRDLHKFSYTPQGWVDDETQVRAFRQMLIELLMGRRPLPVTQFKMDQANSKFPPPPV